MKILIRIVGRVVGIMILGGIGALLLMQVLVPKLALYPQTKDWAIVKSLQERTTIIERTEQMQITQNDVVRDVVGQLRGSIVLVTDVRGALTERSGVVVTGDGIVAATGDVRSVDKDNLRVLSADGEVLHVERVVYDLMTDISFLTVVATRDYAPVSFARAQDLFAGQRLIELGVDRTTVGAVYALITQMQSFAVSANAPLTTQVWDGFVQAQTAQRQAGSVLVTNRGELAGLVDAMPDGDVRIVPASAVTHALWRLLNKRSADVPNLGITYHAITPLTSLHDTHNSGVIVDSVSLGGRGAIAGLQEGDHIIRVDGEDISPYQILPVLLDKKYDATEIALTILRDGEEKRIVITQEKRAELTGTK